MHFSTIKNTLYNNPKGILNSVLSFGLSDRVKSNVRLYFYKFNVYDLVEILFHENYMCVYEFNYTGSNRVDKIKDDLNFYIGYFKSAGLLGKRFLFNVDMMLPVSYADFDKMDNLDINSQAVAFVLDRNGGYVTGENAVNVFTTTERTKNLDECVISFFNNAINTKSPLNEKGITSAGCITASTISGLLNGVDKEKINTELEVVDVNYKFVNTIKGVEFSSSNIIGIKGKLKVDKFNRILKSRSNKDIMEGEVITKSDIKGEVSLSNIISVGLDKFAKIIDNDDIIRVNIDCEFSTIRSAYIVRGVIFITPITMMHLSYFTELLNSDNVEFVLN